MWTKGWDGNSRTHSLVLQGIELAVELHIIPLKCSNFVVFGHGGEGVEEMGTQARVDVSGHVDSGWGAILCPIGEVAW